MKVWTMDHCDYMGISQEEQSLLSNSPNSMFFCSVCWHNAPTELKFLNERNKKWQNKLNLQELEAKLSNT